VLPDSARRCRDCKRLIRGAVGNACPYCGSDKLASVLVQNVSEIRHHSSVLTAAITFCLGLTVIRLIVAFFGPRLSVSFAMTGELVAHLHMLSTGCTVLYLILRHYEGDFRALFTVSLGMFMLTEGVAAIAGRYGMLPLEGLTGLFNITLFMYSSLAVTAAIADGPHGERYHRPLMVACVGFVLLSCMRVLFQMRGGNDAHMNLPAAIILLLVASVVGWLVVRSEVQARPADSATLPAVSPRETASSAPPAASNTAEGSGAAQ